MRNPETFKVKSLENSEWCDKDAVILHACFQLLADCIEQENLLKEYYWGTSSEKKAIKKELEFLYKWWQSRKELDKEAENQDDIDDEMLIRLIKVRRYLWT